MKNINQKNKPTLDLVLSNSGPHQVRAMLLLVPRDPILRTFYSCKCAESARIGITKLPLHSCNFYGTNIHSNMFDTVPELQAVQSEMAKGNVHCFRPNVGDTYDQEALAHLIFSKEDSLNILTL